MDTLKETLQAMQSEDGQGIYIGGGALLVIVIILLIILLL